MPVITRNMVDLKDEILTKIDEKINDFKIAIIAEIKDQIKDQVSEALEKEIKKREELESTVCMLQEHVQNYQKQVNELKDNQDKLEQYGRRLCIRIDGVPMVENETSNDILQNVKSIIDESSSEIQDVAIGKAHRIGKACTDKTSGVKCKSIIIRFTTFRHRTMLYHNRKNLKRNVKVKLDLTKNSIFTEAMQLVKNNEAVKFALVDINCLKVVFKDGNSLFFSDCDNLRDTHFFISNTFIRNARLKLAKNQAKAEQHPEAELLLFENYSLSSSTLPSKHNRRYSKKCTKTSTSV